MLKPRARCTSQPCNWSATEDVPQVQDLVVEKAWLLVDGQVVEELTHSKEPEGHGQ